MLQVKNLYFSYDKTPVLRDISFDVQRGTLCGLFGPNGCGKTTLFRCCLNFLKYHKGNVMIDGVETKNLDIKDMAKLVAYVPQEHKPPFPYLVSEVVLMGRTPYLGGVFGISRKDKKKALDALELLGIAHLADKPYNQLSSGQRQMVLIARAITQETELMFLDEPTSALDFSNQIKIWRLIKKVADEGITILACSHDPNHVLWFCNKTVVMNKKGVVAQGDTLSVISEGVLEKIYPAICSVISVGDLNMVLPSDITKKL